MCITLNSDYLFYFSEENKDVLLHLKRFFKIDFGIGLSNKPLLLDISIDHNKPLSKIGFIEKPLIFPNNYFEYCKSIWQNNRENYYYFSGLMTNKEH